MIALAATVTLPTDAWAKLSAASWSFMKGGIEHRALMAAVGRDHRKAARKGGHLAGGLRAKRRPDRTVQTAAALKQKPSIPAIGQRDRKADRVGFAVDTDALIDHAIGTADWRHRDRDRRGRWWHGCTVPGGASGTSCALVMTMVSRNLPSGQIRAFQRGRNVGELSLAPSALAGEIAIIETAPRARQTIAQSSATFLVGFIVSPRFCFRPAGHCSQAFPRSR